MRAKNRAPASKPRDNFLPVALSENEYNLLDEAAKKAGLKTSGYMAVVAIKAAITELRIKNFKA